MLCMLYTTFTTPLGTVFVATNGTHITHMRFKGQRYFESLPQGWKKGEHKLFAKAKKQVLEYFTGSRKKFDLPLAPMGTEFQKGVWGIVQNIPYGERKTYADVAKKTGNIKAVRAVGTAIGRNPLCVVVPCHRVVSSSGALSGYAGGLKRKQRMLALEESVQ